MREITKIMKGWEFTGPDGTTTTVDLPHTWNARDGQDGGNDYWRGTCIYRTHFAAPQFNTASHQVWIQFDGVNASAHVVLNGSPVCNHDGGYSTFRANITELLRDENELTVEVDNSKNDRVYPQKADFTFYGGIYRDVSLMVVSKNHFTLDYFGGSGIRITPTVQGADASVQVTTWHDGEGEVSIELLDAAGNTVATGKGPDITLTIFNAHLWNGVKDPYLYSCKARLVVNGTVEDETTTRFGVRSFKVDPKKGFFLNGKSYPLHGVSRHQDRKGLGNAITREMHDEDMALIKEIGANTIRLAHYQHDQYFYDLCDEVGMVVWAEIPYISEHMPNGRENTISQMKELIIQNYNHPCIVCWGVSNEITISTKDKADMLDNHRELNDLCHKMDSTRLTTLACYAMCGPFNPVAHITDLVSWNLYLGWYVPGLFLNDLWIGFWHLCYPKRLLGYSEYGAEGMPNLHSDHPRRNDHTEEYQAVYHEYMLRCFRRHPWMWANHVWNMFDFGFAARHEGGVSGRNNKGLITMDRKTKKDSYFVYQAYWSKLPMVHIAGRRHAQRAGETTEIKVYSNQDTVVLYVNGKEVGQQTAHRVFKFNVALEEGFNTILAVAGDVKDSITLEKVEKEPDYYTLPEFNERQEGVANWFKQVGSLDLKAPMEFPEGYYSIKDSMEDLSKNEEALALATRAVKLATNFDIKPGVGMWDMMKRMTPETMAKMINMPDGFIESLNAQLIKIKK